MDDSRHLCWRSPSSDALERVPKELGHLDTAKKHDSVKSIVDLFSVELPFNGKPGHTAHNDAVHVFDPTILRITGDRVIDSLCNSH